jgi:signal transduction histidine kinase
MPILLWNPISVTYLTQVMLVAVIAASLVRTTDARLQSPADRRLTTLLRLSFGFYAAYTVLAFLGVALHPAQQVFVEPLISVMPTASIALFLQFAHRFPVDTGRRLLPAVIGVLSVVALAGEVGFAIYRYVELVGGRVQFRPQFMDLPLIVLTLWLLGLGTAKAVRYWLRRPPDAGPGSPATRHAAAARALFGFTVIPLLLAGVTLVRSYDLIGIEVAQIAMALLNLGGVLSFALLYLNHLATAGSFATKLSATALALVLGVFSGVGWLIQSNYPGAAQHDAVALAGRTVQFLPNAAGGYDATELPFSFEAPAGTRALDNVEVPLPFSFPFFGKTYRDLAIRLEGMIGFGTMPLWSDVVQNGGALPLVVPLAVSLVPPPAGEVDRGLFIATGPDAAVLTWSDLASAGDPAARYTFQTVLRPSGEIRFSYRALPPSMPHDLIIENNVPMDAGITPGYLAGTVKPVQFASGLPIGTSRATGLFEDFRVKFLTDLDQVYRPVAWFTLAASAITMLAFWLLFRFTLVRPLSSLLDGVRRLRGGATPAPLPIYYADEIGGITQSFNEMARAQTEVLQGLETYVAQRTEEVAVLADRNARLEERSRISSDLHDAVSQTLFSALLIADTLPKLLETDPRRASGLVDELGRLNRAALTEMRELLTRVRSAELAGPPLATALTDLVHEFEARHGLAVTLQFTGDAQLGDDVQTVFYRIAQEGLNNIAKHAEARRIAILCEVLDGQAMLTITDDGKGFDPAMRRPGSMGLGIMAERARSVGAALELRSTLGAGTEITLIWNRNDA